MYDHIHSHFAVHNNHGYGTFYKVYSIESGLNRPSRLNQNEGWTFLSGGVESYINQCIMLIQYCINLYQDHHFTITKFKHQWVFLVEVNVVFTVGFICVIYLENQINNLLLMYKHHLIS